MRTGGTDRMNKTKLLISIRNKHRKINKQIDKSIYPADDTYLRGFDDGIYWVFNKVRNQKGK